MVGNPLAAGVTTVFPSGATRRYANVAPRPVMIRRGAPPARFWIYKPTGCPGLLAAATNAISFPPGNQPAHTKPAIPGVGSTLGEPTPVGRITIVGGSDCRNESTCVPSGDIAHPTPSPSLTGKA